MDEFAWGKWIWRKLCIMANKIKFLWWKWLYCLWTRQLYELKYRPVLYCDVVWEKHLLWSMLCIWFLPADWSGRKSSSSIKAPKTLIWCITEHLIPAAHSSEEQFCPSDLSPNSERYFEERKHLEEFITSIGELAVRYKSKKTPLYQFVAIVIDALLVMSAGKLFLMYVS